jgi:hypothetical protein
MWIQRARNVSLPFTCACLAFSLLLFTLLVSTGYGIPVTPTEQQAYDQAVINAQVVTQDKISARLLAIVSDCVVPASNPPYIVRDKVNKERLFGSQIVWNEDHSRILVVSFVDRWAYDNVYKPNLGKEFVLDRSLWVTVAPEMKNFFIQTDPERGSRRPERCPPTVKRIHQLLGINPKNTYEALVEMWVDPNVLFRPSADPETTDHESEIPKISGGSWVFPSDSNPFLLPKASLIDLSKKYVAKPGDTKWNNYMDWFVNRRNTIYQTSDGGWPWTQLGYTYDWANRASCVGLSEFVIRLDPDQVLPPGQTNPFVTVKIKRGVDSKVPIEWNSYFRCRPEPGTEDPSTFPSCPEDLSN